MAAEGGGEEGGSEGEAGVEHQPPGGGESGRMGEVGC
jgi:hypothetical protein